MLKFGFLPRNFLRLGYSMASFSTAHSFQNRLVDEKSPYLLQHAYNPVDWYPWGTEAFKKAKQENKLIFLSIGYSTCHWCHVMEKESFENPQVGALMNEHFVNIKVDREERPDVDRVYMTFLQATQGGGGWPLSVWLTPDLHPIVAGTYFPPDDTTHVASRPGFQTVLKRISSAWTSDPQSLTQQGAAILAALEKEVTRLGSSGQGSTEIPQAEEVMNKCFDQMASAFDPIMGGFGRAPKFPQPVNLSFIFRFLSVCKDKARAEKALHMATHTLKMMARGGMYDHINWGFHRYSTDGDWHVPHFEKMLYDQAQLAVAYASAYQITKDPLFARITAEILEYVTKEMRHSLGGFYSAQDADSLASPTSSAKTEGAFCVWSWQELQDVLNEEEMKVFTQFYDCKEEGNVDPAQDPHNELTNQNVLINRIDGISLAQSMSISMDQLESILSSCRTKLKERRAQRPKPHLDDKIITAWNGLMISGFARSGQTLNREDFVTVAENGLAFVKSHLYDPITKRLYRSVYTGPEGNLVQTSPPIYGFLDDYSFLIRALLDTYECRCHNVSLLEWALTLQETQNQDFWDIKDGGYFGTAEGDPSIVLRLKHDQDGAEPNPSSVSADNLLRLSVYFNRPDFKKKADRIFASSSPQLTRIPMALPEMIAALIFRSQPTTQIVISGETTSPDTKSLLSTVHSFYLPNRVLLCRSSSTADFWTRNQPQFASMVPLEDKATVYLCKDFSCQLPTSSNEELTEMMKKLHTPSFD